MKKQSRNVFKEFFAESLLPGKTKKQKLYMLWFALSFVLLGCVSGPSWLTLVLSVNFIAASVKAVKNVPLKDI